jgi:CRISPR/Cas system Type II protein with McrA/HNH and RuvC-like nuclease domain
MKEKIIQIKNQNPSWGYKRIALAVGCSPNTVKYYVNPEEKKKSYERGCKARKTLNHILKRKKDNFNTLGGYQFRKFSKREESRFSAKELKEKVIKTPFCYLTGNSINLTEAKSYELDHIVPRSKGGTNQLENCGLASRNANRSKADLSLDEFLILCQEVLKNHGFTVTK